MSAFRVGQKVVCIEKDFRSSCDIDVMFAPEPQYGEVCLIVAIVPADEVGCADDLDLAGYEECLFRVDCFRPLAYPSQSLEHDVEAFKQIAGHVPVLDSEDA